MSWRPVNQLTPGVRGRGFGFGGYEVLALKRIDGSWIGRVLEEKDGGSFGLKVARIVSVPRLMAP